MKKLRLIAIAIAFSFSSSLFAQVNWKKFDTSDGLASDSVYKVLIRNQSNIWIATERGLSHFDGTVFTNYTTQNSQLANNQILDLEWAQNKLWVQTSAGLSSFDGITFQNFNTSNGLLSNSLTDITSTSNGTVWAASLNGVVRYDGTQFIHDSAKVAHSIEADTNDRVYILRNVFVGNVPSITMYEVYDSTWTSPPTNNFSTNSTYISKFFKSSKGELLLMERDKLQYAKIDFPFNLTEITLSERYPSPPSSNRILTLHKADDKLFVSRSNDDFFMSSSSDSILNPIIIDNSFTSKAINIASHNELLVVGTFNGILIGSVLNEPLSHTSTFELNQIRTKVRDHGPLFYELYSRDANFEFPKDSNSHGIFAADFIIVAQESNSPNLKINAINPFVRNNNPGPLSDAVGYYKSYMAKVSQQEINLHKTNFNQTSYTMPEGIANWPAVGDSTLNMAADLAPFFDANSNGCYDPENGDHPVIKGDEAIYWINHNAGEDLKLEYHYMLYGYNRPSDPDLNQSVFLQYRVINRGTIDYSSVNVGLFLDGDLGSSVDDFVGCDSIHNIGYVYNGDLFDEAFGGNNGFGANPAALGVKFLSDSMTSLITFSIGNAANGDPLNANDWLNFLNSRWKDSSLVRFGGNGFNSSPTSNFPTKYMYTGSPFPLSGWTEKTPDLNPNTTFSNPPGDRRYLATVPKFALNSGDSKTIEIALGFGRKNVSTTQFGENVPEMIRVLNHVKTVWDTISQPFISYGVNHNCLKNPVGIDEIDLKPTTLTIYPNPSTGLLSIKSDNAIQAIEVYNSNGQLMRSETVQNSMNFSLDFSNFNNGLYFIRIQDASNQWQLKKVMMMK